jgi:hypothetical protein
MNTDIYRGNRISETMRALDEADISKKCAKYALESCGWVWVTDCYYPCINCIRVGRIGRSPIPYLRGRAGGMNGKCHTCLVNNNNSRVPFDKSNEIMVNMASNLALGCRKRSWFADDTLVQGGELKN